MLRNNRYALLTIASLVVLLAACSDPGRTRISGSWTIDQAVNISTKISGGDAVEPEETANMTIDFDRSGKLQTATKMGSIDSKKGGTWKILSYDESTNTMELECSLGLQTTEHQIQFEGIDTMKWVPPNMAGTSQKIRFVRVKK